MFTQPSSLQQNIPTRKPKNLITVHSFIWHLNFPNHRNGPDSHIPTLHRADFDGNAAEKSCQNQAAATLCSRSRIHSTRDYRLSDYQCS
jgi:hypothetical protein